MDFRQLRYFEAVARARNFTRASEQLGIAQPPLSRQIRALEAEVGFTLLDRETRPIRLTEAGRLFYEQAVGILTAVEQLRLSMQQVRSAGQRRFVIGVVGSIMHGAMPRIIRAFRSGSADVEVELIELITLEQVDALKRGRIDAGLGRVRIDDPAIRREILYEEPLVAALPAGSPLCSLERVTLAMLAEHTLIAYPSLPRPSYADQLLSLFRDNGCQPARTLEVREAQTALGLVAAQSGVAVVPQSMLHVQNKDIAYRQISDPGATSPIILSQRRSDASADAERFRATARSVLGGE